MTWRNRNVGQSTQRPDRGTRSRQTHGLPRTPRPWRFALVLLALGTGGCDWWYYKVPPLEAVWYSIPWFDHMINARYVRPYATDSVPRYTPAGSVPVGRTEPDWVAEWTKGDATTANRLVNPYANGATPASRRAPGVDAAAIPRSVDAAGDTLFQTYCAVCHGQAGDGRGPVGPLVGAPSLLSARARAYADGYIYSIIRYGRGAMPRYGDKVYAPDDRWAIVNHLRKLQAATPAAPEDPRMAAPIPPAPSMTGSTGAYPQ